MVGVIIIVVVFTALAAGIYWAASRGGGWGPLGRALMSQGAIARRLIGATLVLCYVGFGIALPAILLIGNHDRASAQVGGVKLNAAEKSGRELFGEHCGVCHTLAAAAAVGKVGPNLDQLKPNESLVLHTLQNGCLQNPSPALSGERCLGYGNMPADIVQGQQAQQVAAFVAKAAGHP